MEEVERNVNFNDALKVWFTRNFRMILNRRLSDEQIPAPGLSVA
jgi:hypothetical protein